MGLCKYRQTFIKENKHFLKEENINVNEINDLHIYRNAYLYCYNQIIEEKILKRLENIHKKSSRNQMKINKYREAGNTTEFHISKSFFP